MLEKLALTRRRCRLLYLLSCGSLGRVLTALRGDLRLAPPFVLYAGSAATHLPHVVRFATANFLEHDVRQVAMLGEAVASLPA